MSSVTPTQSSGFSSAALTSEVTLSEPPSSSNGSDSTLRVTTTPTTTQCTNDNPASNYPDHQIDVTVVYSRGGETISGYRNTLQLTQPSFSAGDRLNIYGDVRFALTETQSGPVSDGSTCDDSTISASSQQTTSPATRYMASSNIGYTTDTVRIWTRSGCKQDDEGGWCLSPTVITDTCNVADSRIATETDASSYHQWRTREEFRTLDHKIHGIRFDQESNGYHQTIDLLEQGKTEEAEIQWKEHVRESAVLDNNITGLRFDLMTDVEAKRVLERNIEKLSYLQSSLCT